MGAKVKTTSNSATPVGADFNRFLQRGMDTGTYGNGAINQTQGVGGAINNLINQRGTPDGVNDWKSILSQMGQSGAVPQVGNPFATLPNLGIPGKVGNVDTGMDGVNAPAFQAIQQMMANQKARDLGDIHSRYGLGSADQNASSLYNSQVDPAMAMQMNNVSNSQRQLAQGDVGLNLQGLGLASQDQIARAYMLQHSDEANAQNALSMFNMRGNLALGGGNLALNNANSSANIQQQALESLLRMYGLSNQLGTPQAQSFQQGGLLNDILGSANGIMSLFGQAKNAWGGNDSNPFDTSGYQLPPNLYDPSTLQPSNTPSNH